MRIIIGGGSGLIGSTLAKNLASDGYEVIILTRKDPSLIESSHGIRFEKWDGSTADGWGHLVNGAGAIVNLAGENLSAGRWSERRKQAILQSRVDAGAAMVQAIQQATHKPDVLIQSSAVGCYGTDNPRLLDESTLFGNDYLAGVCKSWEASTQAVDLLGVRRVVARTGVVLSMQAGALPRMVLPFKFFIGGTLGSGRQWMSWVHLKDEVRALRFFIETPKAYGAFNISAQPVTNRQFAQTIGKVMERPAFINVPALIIRLLFGEMGTVVLDGQRVSSKRLEDLGFHFHFPDAETALVDLLHSEKKFPMGGG